MAGIISNLYFIFIILSDEDPIYTKNVHTRNSNYLSSDFTILLAASRPS